MFLHHKALIISDDINRYTLSESPKPVFILCKSLEQSLEKQEAEEITCIFQILVLGLRQEAEETWDTLRNYIVIFLLNPSSTAYVILSNVPRIRYSSTITGCTNAVHLEDKSEAPALSFLALQFKCKILPEWQSIETKQSWKWSPNFPSNGHFWFFPF